MTYHSLLPEWQLANQSVLVRADLNVPFENTTIEDDFRLQQLRPTLDYLLAQKCTITLLTHIGGAAVTQEHPSTTILEPWFRQNDYPVFFAPTFSSALDRIKMGLVEIVLFENLRRFAQEVARDHSFAQQLAQLGTFFVQDAFGALHKNDSSITLLPSLFPPDKRTIGLCVQKELAALDAIKNNPAQPFMAIIGGNKIAEKIDFITALAHKTTCIMLCPALVFTFLYALGHNVGQSFVDKNSIAACAALLALAKKKSLTLLFAIDYLVATDGDLTKMRVIQSDEFNNNDVGISLGPKTVALFCQYIQNAQTTFLNGAIGFPQKPETLDAMNALINAMSASSGTTIIAGGDSVFVARKHHAANRITHLSCGGGSALAYISGHELPGLVALYGPDAIR